VLIGRISGTIFPTLEMSVVIIYTTCCNVKELRIQPHSALCPLWISL